MQTMKSVFTIDVEDWFHILDVPSAPPLSEWASLPSRVERNFHKLLDLLDEKKTKASCFFLGWVARRFPNLVLEASKRGHEIASHGDNHLLAYQVSADQFFQDAHESKSVLEQLIGKPVLGYRASGFSVTQETPWFFEKLMEAGYKYDSSVFPAPRGHGGLKGTQLRPYLVSPKQDFVEFPATVERVGGKSICFFGGGYLRFFPYVVIRRMAKRVLKQNRPVIFYIHPREIDPVHPRLAMGWKRQFKTYYNLESTENKISKLLSEFEMTTFQNILASGWQANTSSSARN